MSSSTGKTQVIHGAMTQMFLENDEAPWFYGPWQETTGIMHGLFPTDDSELPKGWTREIANSRHSYFEQFNQQKSQDDKIKFATARKNAAHIPGRIHWRKFITENWKRWGIHSKINAVLLEEGIHPLIKIRIVSLEKGAVDAFEALLALDKDKATKAKIQAVILKLARWKALVDALRISDAMERFNPRVNVTSAKAKSGEAKLNTSALKSLASQEDIEDPVNLYEGFFNTPDPLDSVALQHQHPITAVKVGGFDDGADLGVEVESKMTPEELARNLELYSLLAGGTLNPPEDDYDEDDPKYMLDSEVNSKIKHRMKFIVDADQMIEDIDNSAKKEKSGKKAVKNPSVDGDRLNVVVVKQSKPRWKSMKSAEVLDDNIVTESIQTAGQDTAAPPDRTVHPLRENSAVEIAVTTSLATPSVPLQETADNPDPDDPMLGNEGGNVEDGTLNDDYDMLISESKSTATYPGDNVSTSCTGASHSSLSSPKTSTRRRATQSPEASRAVEKRPRMNPLHVDSPRSPISREPTDVLMGQLSLLPAYTEKSIRDSRVRPPAAIQSDSQPTSLLVGVDQEMTLKPRRLDFASLSQGQEQGSSSRHEGLPPSLDSFDSTMRRRTVLPFGRKRSVSLSPPPSSMSSINPFKGKGKKRHG
ncbi:hypothetical protein CVT25_000921 [Psilocybe cyanescens]|uniref:Uncharacterized protein n=1 Tax=Psilocybe cyanescens TaxID=93625 RepID=A0A409XX95_PSICY|nr:hypothetical protein CVT25_000921 [Psilocybe cyanescens]